MQKASTRKPLFLLHFKLGAWRCPTLTWGGPTLPSAISHFTAEFGMGSGGSNFLWSPGLFVLSYGLCVMSTLSLNSGIQSLSFLAAHSCVWHGLLKTHNPQLLYKSLWRYMVKPHESLVLVSSMPHSTYTPNLSTSSSLTALQCPQGAREVSS